ncbi:hypothetical protein CANCADRAFT_90718 [Tortispora caseinolytica NRRL Y-17796]|uniref:THIF-type NAD/FAD binding fold domain-containing protein n=1 Tax=Tortispora caseinolytica NRRL Y-17796 TaxID=767744 RepID=A0A1E4TLR3_9ASCO|nr:hypothetical protein CANCADRAFT_90718 [Tortispora caseinolytica NRRL Y-17796]
MIKDARCVAFVLGALSAWAVAAALRSLPSTNDELKLKIEPRNERPKTEWDEDIINEQLARNIAFLGEDGVRKLREMKVVVVGAGGVGSWVVTMLARSGVGRIRVIDFDQVTLSSLNRHAVAALADVGTPKASCIARRLRQVVPWIEIEPMVELWTKEDAAALFSGEFDLVIDAIDNIDTKVDLIEYCVRNELKIVSAMGSATKSDPSRITIGDISSSTEDPLSRATRRRLRLRGISSGVTIAYSLEKPDPRKAKLLPLNENSTSEEIDEFAVLPNFRSRILPVLGPMPGMLGLAIASHVLVTYGGYDVAPEYSPVRERTKIYDSVLQTAQSQAIRLEKRNHIDFDAQDTAYLIEEVFRGRSVVSREFTRLAFTKWDPADPRPLCMHNVVLMTKTEVQRHELAVLSGKHTLEEVYSPEVIALVRRRFHENDLYDKWRF